MPIHDRLARFGCVLLAAMTATIGLLSIVTGDFAYTWQPVSETLPFRATAARAVGLVLVIASGLFLAPRTARRGLFTLTIIFAAWLVLLHVPGLLSGKNWLGFFEFLLPLGACVALIGVRELSAESKVLRRLTPGQVILVGRLICGVGLIGCGASHFVYGEFAAQMIPAWIPGRLFFTYLTGAGHIAAGASLMAGLLLRLSTALLCFMFACFVLLLHVPRVLADPTSRYEWTMLFVAVLFNGAVWLIAAAVRATPFAPAVREAAPASVRPSGSSASCSPPPSTAAP